MDGVLTKHPSSWEYVHRKLGVDNGKNLQLYREEKLSYIEFLRSDVRLWINENPGISEQDVRKILETIPERDGIPETMAKLHSGGITTAIISGGIYWLAERICRDSGIDYVFANGIRTDSTGRLLPDGDVVVEPRYKDRVLLDLQDRLKIGKDETASVGDTYQDNAMFMHSGISIAFNAKDPRVSKAATFSSNGDDLRIILPYLI